MIYFRLCKAGYARSVTEAQSYDARTVLQALNYEAFCSDYERTFYDLNSPKG